MNKIIIDLEFTPVSGKNKEVRAISHDEIIQIGAVKLNSNNEQESFFNMLVKPEFSSVSKRVTNLTGITNEMLEDAPSFEMAYKEFLDWIGEGEYSIFSWSDCDMHIIENAIDLFRIEDVRTKSLINNWIDLQAMISQMIGLTNSLSLANVMKAADISFEGHQHSAIDDAENTAKIYCLAQDEDKFNKAMGPVIELFRPKKTLSFSMADMLQGFTFSDVETA